MLLLHALCADAEKVCGELQRGEERAHELTRQQAGTAAALSRCEAALAEARAAARAAEAQAAARALDAAALERQCEHLCVTALRSCQPRAPQSTRRLKTFEPAPLTNHRRVFLLYQ